MFEVLLFLLTFMIKDYIIRQENKREQKERKMQNILEGLNDKQYEAVTNTEGPCLVIARCRKWKNKSINT